MSQDTLSDWLRSVRLRRVLFFHVERIEPWGIKGLCLVRTRGTSIVCALTIASAC